MTNLDFFEPYDDGLFAFNPHGLASYLERRGWAEIEAMPRPHAKTYARLCPASSDAANALFSAIPDRRRWGRQREHGGWCTRTMGQPTGRFAVRIKGSLEPYFIEPLAASLGEFDVVKHLCGRTLSLASTDRPCPDAYEGHRPVSCLRLDTDMDEAFLHERSESVLAELREQRALVGALGLPFAAFKTGGRGFQTIVSLPCPLGTAAASFLSRGIRLALRGRTNLSGAKVDRDAFDGLMRLPGGVHALRNASLFIDVDRERLHSPTRQAELMASCLLPRPGEAPWSPSADEMLRAQVGLMPCLNQVVARDFQVLNDRDVLRVLRAEPNNLLCRMVARAFEAAGADLDEALRWKPAERFAGERPDSIYHCDKEWAERVWAMDIAPGGHWQWIHMGGHRGMLSAVILFGSEKAEEELLAKAEAQPAASRTDARERLATTRALWRSFALKDFVPRSIVSVPASPFSNPDERTESIARQAAEQAKALCPGSRWNVNLMMAVLAVSLQPMREAKEPEAVLSVREIAYRVERAYGHLACNEAKAQRYLSLVLRDEESSNRPVLEALVRVQMAGWKGEKSLFLPGRAVSDEILLERGEREVGVGERPDKN